VLREKEQEASDVENRLDTLKSTKEAKKNLLTEIADLKVQYDLDKKNGRIEANNRERDKIYAVKKLSEEMDFKVKETQANLMALNDEQLQTTTRLTILQNHQLTTELDYQSKQTENLVAKNDEMTKKIEVLKRNISLHKNIEKKLAKRAYKSQKVIAELKGEAEKLEKQKNALNVPDGSKQEQNSRYKNNGGPFDGNGDNLEGEDLIDFLESKLEGIEKKLSRSQADYEELQNDCLEIQDKLSFQKEKYKRAALMLTEFLEDLLSQKPNILKDQMNSIQTVDRDHQEDDVDIEKI